MFEIPVSNPILITALTELIILSALVGLAYKYIIVPQKDQEKRIALLEQAQESNTNAANNFRNEMREDIKTMREQSRTEHSDLAAQVQGISRHLANLEGKWSAFAEIITHKFMGKGE